MSKYISHSYNFWTLTRNSIEEMERQGNKNYVVSEYSERVTEKESWQNFELQTKWNDQNIGIPILFNFYHGLELYMKGLLEMKKISFEKKRHNLKLLFELIKTNENLYSIELISLLEKHIDNPEEYNNFFKDNKIEVNNFYECFRYPENNNKTIEYFYGNIRGKQEETLILYKELKKATIDFYNAIVRWNCKSDDCSEYLKEY
jgi:hypothetical protein